MTRSEAKAKNEGKYRMVTLYLVPEGEKPFLMRTTGRIKCSKKERLRSRMLEREKAKSA